MTHKTFILAMALTFSTAAEVCMAQADKDGVEVRASQPTIDVRNSQVIISNAQGCQLTVYSITGMPVTTLEIDSNEKVLQLKKGYYLIKVGDVVRKVYIKGNK